MSKKFNIKLGNSEFSLYPPDKQNELLAGRSVIVDADLVESKHVTESKIELDVSKLKYSSAIKDCIKYIFRENQILIYDESMIDEIARSTYDHFMTVLQRENNIKIIEKE